MKTLGCQHGPVYAPRVCGTGGLATSVIRYDHCGRCRAVHFQIHLLIEEAQMAFYASGCGYGGRIVPDDCFPGLTARLHRVVRRNPLVGTFRFLVAREQYILRDFLRGK